MVTEESLIKCMMNDCANAMITQIDYTNHLKCSVRAQAWPDSSWLSASMGLFSGGKVVIDQWPV